MGKHKGAVPDGGWGWFVVAGSTLIHFLIVGTGRCFGVFYLDLLDRFQQSALATAWVIAIFNTMRMAFGPVAGLLCDRFTCRKVVLCGAVLISVGFIITSFATSLVYTYISFGLLAGFGGSFLFTPSYVVVGQYFDKNKGKAMSIATLGSGLGMVSLAPLIQFLLDTYSFFGAMLILGAIMSHNLIAGLLFRPLPPPPKVEEMQELPEGGGRGSMAVASDNSIRASDGVEEGMDLDRSDNTAGVEGAQPSGGKSSFWSLLKRQLLVLSSLTFLMYGVHIFCMSICIQTFLSFLPAIAEQYGSTRHSSSLLLSLLGVADMAGRILWGFFFDLQRVRHRRRLFHTLLGIPVAVVTGLTGFISSYWALFGMTILFGLVEGGFHSQRATIVSEFVAKDQMSSTVGFVIFFQGFGNLAGPPFAGYLRDTFGTYNFCYFFAGICLLISSIAFLVEYFLRKALTPRSRANIQTSS